MLSVKEILEAQVIYVSHSGGKDSQAMLAKIKRMGLLHKVVIVHADLGEMEWEPMHGWIESISFGKEVHIVKAEMDFFEMSRKYNRLPSGMHQFCTDFLKIQPIAKFIHQHMTANGYTRAINATGIRAGESTRRANKADLMDSNFICLSEMTQPKKYPGHVIHDWLPIFDLDVEQVKLLIASVGQVPHKIYSQGFSRLSCAICINGRVAEHELARTMKPELFNKMLGLEKELGKGLRTTTIKKVKYARFLDGTVGPAIQSAAAKVPAQATLF